MFKQLVFSATLLSACNSFALQPEHLNDLGEVTQGLFVPSLFSKSLTDIQATPQKISLTLEGLGQVDINIQQSKTRFGHQLLTGTLMQDGQMIPFSEVILVEAKNNTVMGSIETTMGKWLIIPDLNSNQQYLIKRHQPEINDKIIQDPQQLLLNQVTEEKQADVQLTPSQTLPQAAPDTDPDGNTIIDIYMGFSEKALHYVQDKDAFAVMQIATVNNALKNSNIENIQVRLVGTGTTNEHMGMSSHQLPMLKDWFSEDIKKFSPDVVTGYMLWEDGFENQATGWGYVNGYYNINDIKSPNAFRHELGHNIGGVHCNDRNGYNFGYDNGMSRTHQCGNDINYYSNPNITDMYGLAIGDKNTANMAQVWRDNASRHSSYRPAVVPFENEEQTLILHKTHIDVANQQWDFANINVPEGTTRMVITLNDGENSQGGGTRLYIQKSTKPSSNSYHSASHPTQPYYVNNHAMAVNNVSAGNWVVGINNIRDESKDLQLKVYLYGTSDDTDNSNNTDNGMTDPDTSTDTSNDNKTKITSLMSNPLNGSILVGSSVTFTYNNTDRMWLDVGSKQDDSDIFNGAINGTNTLVDDLPEDGSTIYVTLWSYLGGEWIPNQYSYVSQKKVQDNNADSSVNTAPVAIINTPSTVTTPNSIELDGSKSFDADGNALTYIWRQISGIDVAIQNSDQAKASFNVSSLAQDEVVTFRLTVFDGNLVNMSEASITLKANTQNSSSNNGNDDLDDGSAAQDELQDKEQDNIIAEVTIKKGAGSNSPWGLLFIVGIALLRNKKQTA